MPKGRNSKVGKGQGGRRRNIRMPCGKVFQGQPDRLQGMVSAHQKVCLECACRDCSFAWKEEFSKCPNATDIRGSNSGATNNFRNAQTLTALAPTGERLTTSVPKTGGMYDTITKHSANLVAEGEASFRAKASKPNKKRKGKKKPKVQTGWGASPTPEGAKDEVIVLSFDDDEVDEDFYKVLQSITADLSMDEIMESLIGRGAELVSATDGALDRLEAAKDSILGNPINQRLTEAGMSPILPDEAGDILRRIGQ
jgi:hypothetical protein